MNKFGQQNWKVATINFTLILRFMMATSVSCHVTSIKQENPLSIRVVTTTLITEY